VRVIREKMGPHETAPRHRHPEPGVVVFLTDQNISQTSEDGSTRVVRHKAGDVAWSPASTHKDENLNDAAFEYVEIEPKGGAAAPPSAAENKLEAAIVDPKHYHVEFENDLVRVIRFPMEPHDKTLLHTHPSTGAVIVALTDQNTRQTLADGAAREIRHKAGEAWWGAPNFAHQDENKSDTRAVVIRIELKQAR
jgi:quercetin dioxygenase-like cupin family protein